MKNLALAIALITVSGAAMAQGKTSLNVCFNAETGSPVLVSDKGGINRSFAIYDLDKAAYGETSPMWKPLIVSPAQYKTSTFSDGHYTQTVDDSYIPTYMVNRASDNMTFLFNNCHDVYKPEQYASFLAGEKLTNLQLQTIKRDVESARGYVGRLDEPADPQFTALKFHQSDILEDSEVTPELLKDNQVKSDAFFASQPKSNDEGKTDAQRTSENMKRIAALPFEWATQNHHVISTCDLITTAPGAKYNLPVSIEKGAIKIIENGKILTATFKHARDSKPSTMKFAIIGFGSIDMPAAGYSYNSWDLSTTPYGRKGYNYYATNCQIEKQ